MKFNIGDYLEKQKKKQYAPPQENIDWMSTMPTPFQPGYVGQQPAQPSNITIPFRPGEAPVDIQPQQVAPAVETISQSMSTKAAAPQGAPKTGGGAGGDTGALEVISGVAGGAGAQDAQSGAIQGLLAGAKTGNPYAAVAGAVVGGAMGGMQARQARKAQQRQAKAKSLQNQSKIYESEAQQKSAALRNFMGTLGR